MKLTTVLPTEFAVDLAIESGLLPAPRNMHNVMKYDNIIVRLKQFQQMAITSTVEEAKCAFHAIELNSVQEDALFIIHSHTCQWLRGHVTGVLLERLNDARTGNRDFAEAISLVVDTLKSNGPAEGDVPNQPRKGLLITLTTDGTNYDGTNYSGS